MQGNQYLAQLNIGRLKALPNDRVVADFMDNIERINQLGRDSPGFVWMMEGSSQAGNTENYIGDDPQMIANLTMWQDLSSLLDFAIKTEHAEFMKRRGEWFEVMDQAYFVMWWVESEDRPSLDEAMERLEYLRKNGESAYAFGWKFAKHNYG